MPLTAAQVQARILERTGDFDPTTGDPVVGGGGYLEQQIAGVWAEYADKAYITPRLQELYTERDLLRRGLNYWRQKYDFRDSDADFSRSQWFDHGKLEFDIVVSQIEELLAMAAANRAGAVGPITAVAPIGAPFPLGLDANSRRYGGDPYFRRPWGYP